MDIKPQVAAYTPWDKAVGIAKFQLLLDSEFCPGEGFELEQELQHRKGKDTPLNLPGLGKKGAGQYSLKRGPPNMGTPVVSGQVTENIEAMSMKEFSRYLRKLRKLRPAFAAFLKQQGHLDHLRGKSLYSIAQNREATYYQLFLQKHLADEFSSLDSSKIKIEHQPHPNGGLLYAHPTPLDTHFHTKAQPGMVLNSVSPRANWRYGNQSKHESFVASFGGLTATLLKSESGGKRPLLELDSETGVDLSRIEESIANMRPKKIYLQSPPKVVGRHPQGLEGVRLEAEVTAREGSHSPDNPNFPGCHKYNSHERIMGKAAERSLSPPILQPKSWGEVSKGTQGIMSTLQSLISGEKRAPGQRPPDGSAKGL
jgi:hypothetical protein